MSRLIGVALVAFAAAAFVGQAAPQPADGDPIQEAMYVPIGGIEQWITIKGTDRANPVVLFLHGGPGGAWSPIADSLFPGWEQDFTLVQWDQRDAGRTFVKNGEAVEPTISVERMTADGIEVAEFLQQHLRKSKIILTGGSWGAVLGLRMAHARPDLFHAYAGLAQPTSWQQVVAASYARVKQLAQAKGDAAALEALSTLGPPPWDSADEFMSFSSVRQPYQAGLTTAPDPRFALSGEYAADVQQNGERNRTFAMRYTLALLTPIDLTALTDFDLPIFLIHGEVDLTIPLPVTRAYFETIEAPRKELYVVPGTGHNPSATELEKLREILLTEVRPLAIR
jgi:pimeloyl-ACP methyl ester carboxylesterase